MMKTLKALLATFFFMSLSLQAQVENALLWKITSPAGAESYLFGTYHLLGSSYLEEHPKVKSAFQRAETVVVETVIDSSQLMEVTMAGLVPGKSLQATVDSADYALLKKRLELTLGMDLSFADQMHPMALSAAYVLQLARENTPEDFSYSGMPIDLHFAEQAKRSGQNLIGLETMLEQVEILYGSQSYEEQARQLVAMVKQAKESEELTREIIKAYQREDLNKMLGISAEFEESQGDLAVVLYDRNEKWLEQLIPLLKQGSVFVAVGALHLPGEKGLIALLRTQGFKISPY